MTTLICLILFAALIYFFLNRSKQKTSTTTEDNKQGSEFLSTEEMTAIRNNAKPSSENDGLFNVSSVNDPSNTVTFSINVNEDELLKRVKNGTLNGGQKREVSIEDITGFYGNSKFSPDKKYCVSFCEGHQDSSRWKNGSIALLHEQALLYKNKAQRPNDCKVTNDGFVICCDWLNSEEGLTGKFLVFNPAGEVIFSKKTTANLGNCAISDDSKFAIFETYASETTDSDKIFVVDVDAKKIISKFERPYAFNDVEIDTTRHRIVLKNNKGFSFEIDFKGKQTNKEEYQGFVLKNGSVLDKVCFYEELPEKIRYKSDGYLESLDRALTNRESLDYFGKDKVYRSIGDYHEANGNSAEAITNWEKAIEINPKIGVKRKLDALKKKQ